MYDYRCCCNCCNWGGAITYKYVPKKTDTNYVNTNYTTTINTTKPINKIVVSRWIDIPKTDENNILNTLKISNVDKAVNNWRDVHYKTEHILDYTDSNTSDELNILNMIDNGNYNEFNIIQQDVRPGTVVARVNKTNRIVSVYYEDGTVCDIVNRDLLNAIDSCK